MHKIQKTIEEWQDILPPKVFAITRSNGTEQPFNNLYYNNHSGTGFYRCSNCGLTLFNGSNQFESGTGWPSFWQPFKKEHVVETSDPDGIRTAVNCARCNSHLGHVFNDGPEPTGRRYCMNSAALVFIPDTWQED